MELTIQILAEETVRRAGLLAEHGLAFWVEFQSRRFLFDTGQLLALKWNGERLGVNLAVLDFVALSHGHYDHTGGLEAVLKACSKLCPVFAHPDIFQKKFHKKGETRRFIGIPRTREAYETLGAKFQIESGWQELAPGVYLTGEIPRKTDFETIEPGFEVQADTGFVPDAIWDDQALVLKTSKGAVVLLGCGHAGVVNTLQAIREHLHLEYFYAILGGFHLVNASEERIHRTVEALREFSFYWISPLHCTGFRARAEIFRAFPEQFVDLHTGDNLAF